MYIRNILGTIIGAFVLAGCGAGYSHLNSLEESADMKMVMSAYSEEGLGPGMGGDQYDSIVENQFLQVSEEPRSTFSVDVDTASYANARRFLLQNRRLTAAGSVRIEEFINYFSYDYPAPDNEVPFLATMDVTTCPWNAEHRLLRIGIKGKEIQQADRPSSNLVFLIDVSGSMDSPDKLPLLVQAMNLMVDQLDERDRVAIVVYASNTGLILDSTPGNQKGAIRAALSSLRASGSTAGGEGIQQAYKTAKANFIEGGVNRVFLCTDGDFNVGISSDAALVEMIEKESKSGVYLSVLGFGRGNLNDSMMEKISNKGNGNYSYIDTYREATKVLGEQIQSNMITIAKDVKLQVEFNPAQVAGYRLIGYENRVLANEDFNDDTKDAGEIGAGHTVTALYEIVPSGYDVESGKVDPLKYQQQGELTKQANSGELCTLKIRFKQPDGDTSEKLEFTAMDYGREFGQADKDFQFAAAVASFGMLLRDSKFKGDSNYDMVYEIARSAMGADEQGYRSEFLEMVEQAKRLQADSHE